MVTLFHVSESIPHVRHDPAALMPQSHWSGEPGVAQPVHLAAVVFMTASFGSSKPFFSVGRQVRRADEAPEQEAGMSLKTVNRFVHSFRGHPRGALSPGSTT